MNGVFRILMILIPLSFPLAQVSVRFSGIPLYIPEILLVLAGAAFLFVWKGGCLRLRPLPVRTTLFVGLFFTGSLMSVLLTSPDMPAIGALKSWIILPIFWAWLLFQGVRTLEDRAVLRTAWLVGAVVTGLVSLSDLSFVRITYDGRLASFYPSPNHLAMFLEPAACIAILGLVASIQAGKKWISAFYVAAAAVLAAVLLKTGSEGALIAVAVACVSPIIARNVGRYSLKRTLIILVALVVTAAGLLSCLLGLEGELSRLGSAASRSSLSSRVMIWKAAVTMLRSHPIAGIGPRRFQEEYLALQPSFQPYLEWAVPHAHSLFLSVWLGTGMIGLIGFIFLGGDALWRMLRRRTATGLADTGLEYASYLAVTVVILVHGLVDTPFLRNDLSLGFFTLLGLLWSATAFPNAAKNRPRIGRSAGMTGDML